MYFFVLNDFTNMNGVPLSSRQCAKGAKGVKTWAYFQATNCASVSWGRGIGMRPLDFGCKNIIFTRFCLPICVRGIWGQATLILACPMLSMVLCPSQCCSLLHLLKCTEWALRLVLLITHHRRGKVGAVNLLLGRQKPNWAYRSHRSFLGPRPAGSRPGTLPRGPWVSYCCC